MATIYIKWLLIRKELVTSLPVGRKFAQEVGSWQMFGQLQVKEKIINRGEKFCLSTGRQPTTGPLLLINSCCKFSFISKDNDIL